MIVEKALEVAPLLLLSKLFSRGSISGDVETLRSVQNTSIRVHDTVRPLEPSLGGIIFTAPGRINIEVRELQDLESPCSAYQSKVRKEDIKSVKQDLT